MQTFQRKFLTILTIGGGKEATKAAAILKAETKSTMLESDCEVCLTY